MECDVKNRRKLADENDFFSLMSITSENGNEQFCEKAGNDSLRRTMIVEDVKTL